MRQTIRSCLMELCSNIEIDEYNNYLLYSSIEDSKVIEKTIYSLLNKCQGEKGVNVNLFEDNVNENDYFTIFPISNYTSTVYSYYNGNVTAGHTVRSYGEVNFDNIFHVDLDKSEEYGDTIKLLVTDGQIVFTFKLKDFYYGMDPSLNIFEGILTNIEVLGLILIQICKNISNFPKQQNTKVEFINPMIFIVYAVSYLDNYCNEVKYDQVKFY